MVFLLQLSYSPTPHLHLRKWGVIPYTISCIDTPLRSISGQEPWYTRHTRVLFQVGISFTIPFDGMLCGALPPTIHIIITMICRKSSQGSIWIGNGEEIMFYGQGYMPHLLSLDS